MISFAQNFSTFFDMENLYKAYLTCRKGKRKAINTRGFEANLFHELLCLSSALQNETYKPSRSVCFYVKKPKLREIFASDFRDRVLHRMLVDILEPHYEKKFITDSYACREEKGTHKAVEKLREFIRSGTKNKSSPLYYLQLDIKGFFMQIHKPTLIDILAKNIKDEKLISIVKAIIHHNPAKHFVFRGKIPPKGILPPHKTLFHEDTQKGIPIGNLTSQFFANVYLNELDQFIKRKLGVQYYIRYVDDFILMHSDRQLLLQWKNEIITYLQNHLKLVLKDEKVKPLSVYKGIDFLGYFIKPGYTLVRRRVLENYKKTLSEVLPPAAKTGKRKFIGKYYPQSLSNIRILQARLNSYIAHFRHANAFYILKQLEDRLKPYASVLFVKDNYIRIPKYLNHFYRFRHQIAYFLNKFPDKLLIFPVGRFFEIYGKEAGEIARLCGLKPYQRSSMITFGIPRRFHRKQPDCRRITLKDVCKTAKKNHIPYVIFRQDKEETERVKTRLPLFGIHFLQPLQLEFPF